MQNAACRNHHSHFGPGPYGLWHVHVTVATSTCHLQAASADSPGLPTQIHVQLPLCRCRGHFQIAAELRLGTCSARRSKESRPILHCCPSICLSSCMPCACATLIIWTWSTFKKVKPALVHSSLARPHPCFACCAHCATGPGTCGHRPLVAGEAASDYNVVCVSWRF